jgi:hypothetical protein
MLKNISNWFKIETPGAFPVKNEMRAGIGIDYIINYLFNVHL